AIRAFLPDMEARNSGQIVTISSVAGHFGETYGMAYCPAKFAVRGIMESLEMEHRDRGLTGIVCTTVCPWFVRTPMILNMGMRPTSRWISFMSINRCANQIVDAILKEKNVTYVPFLIRVMVMLKPFMSKRVQLALRSYLNCRYEPTECQTTNEKEVSKEERTPSLSTLGNMGDYFKVSNFIWFLIIPAGLLLTFLVWWRPELFNQPTLSLVGQLLYYLGTQYNLVILVINIAAWVAHLGEAIYALHICDSVGFSHACTFKWFLQTFILGFPSLSILIHYRNKVVK
uniref:Transmembrane protein 254 n=1 Tax=Acrobeloides nanus TaxID=290746 RepID=A0A914DZ97_9BILA